MLALKKCILTALLCCYITGDATTATDTSTFKEELNVLVLDDKNFDDALKTYKFLLAEFYAPWCGHCKSLAPEYASAAKKLREAHPDKPLRLAKIDATVQKQLATRFSIKGFPTLKFFKEGSEIAYKGGRTADAIVKWVERKLSPATVNVANQAELQTLLAKHAVFVLGFFKDAQSEPAKEFAKFADAHEDVFSGVTSSAELFKEYSVTGDYGLTLFKNFDDKMATFVESKVENRPFNSANITHFVDVNRMPAVMQFSSAAAAQIFSGPVKRHVLAFVFNKTQPERTQKIRGEFARVAPKYRGKALFITVDVDVAEHERILEFFQMQKSEVPNLRVIEMADDGEVNKFRPEDVQQGETTDKTTTTAKKQEGKDGDSKKIFSKPFNLEDSATVDEFVAGILAGKIEPFRMSEPIPADWDKQPVKVLVGKNFDKVVFDPNKHVFVEFYAPWCGHCKKLAPIWDQLGEAYKNSKDIIIAKMDSTKNEVVPVKIQSFPTIKFFPKGDQPKIVDYAGERTLDALKKFLDSGGEPNETPKSKEEL